MGSSRPPTGGPWSKGRCSTLAVLPPITRINSQTGVFATAPASYLADLHWVATKTKDALHLVSEPGGSEGGIVTLTEDACILWLRIALHAFPYWTRGPWVEHSIARPSHGEDSELMAFSSLSDIPFVFPDAGEAIRIVEANAEPTVAACPPAAPGRSTPTSTARN